MNTPSGWHQEGKATFFTDNAFYRPQSQVGRDLAVLAAAVYRRQNGQLRVLDAMTGCGVRPLRYQLEAEADWVWANEANPDHREVLERNLSTGMRPRSYRITHQDANQVFFDCYQQRDFYDLVDIDNFGSPSPYASTGMWATRLGGMLYLTSTDGRATGGHDPERSLQTFGAYARSHPAVHEQGLRLLLGHAMQQAAAKGFGIQPLFSLFNGQVHRVMVRLVMDPSWEAGCFGFIGYCHVCGHFQTVGWRQLGRVKCACHRYLATYLKPHPLVLSGPLWLGPLHDPLWLNEMKTLASGWGWSKRVKLLEIMQAEADMPPYYYPLGEIGRLGQIDIPRREVLMQALCDRNFRATLTHLDWEAVKTDATMAECVAIARQIQRK
ncbi:MAG: tRNA (guanine-N1)-methyltransferase [Cyanobacteria bacterium Co-bin13]|nr:tRNA (guanine-N1)-methyltransferase [Cyanobacteria bacterium Co-bin13]